MELLVPLFACGSIVAFLTLIFGLSWAWARWERSRMDDAARELGLAIDPDNFDAMGWLFHKSHLRRKMRGERGGVPVEVGIRIVVTGSGKNRRTTYYTYAKAFYPRSLDLGLVIRPLGWFERVLDTGTDIQVGHPKLDPSYDIRAAEPELTRSLVRLPYVEEGLVWLSEAAFRPHVDDVCVRCERRAKVLGARPLAVALDSAVDLARRVAAGRAAIGPSSLEWAMQEPWRRVAQARGLALDAQRMQMTGRVEGVHVEMKAELRGQQRFTVLTARFDRPLGASLKLTRQTGASAVAKLFGGQDIQVGDPLFDDRFVVKGSPVDAVRAVLTPEVRMHLVVLQDQCTMLEVADHHVHAEVSWLVMEEGWIDGALVAVARAAAALQRLPAATVGPYRQ